MAKRRKTRTHNLKGDPEAHKKDVPKSFVVKSGEVGSSVENLVRDVRKVFEPNTASRLRERKSNRIRDYVAMAGPLGVSHLVCFSQPGASITTSSSAQKNAHVNLRISRFPRGPTLTFRVLRYALTRDILSSTRRPKNHGISFATEPMLILNNFGGEEKQTKLTATVFQNLFPSINVHTMHLSQARRIILLSYNKETRTIDFRHYLITVRPTGVSKNIRKLTTSSASLPDFSSVQDLSEILLREGDATGFVSSASDAESDISGDENREGTKVVLGDDYIGRGNKRSEKRAIRLTEIGPRMELGLIKIEDSVESGKGETLFHEYVAKTNKEVAKLKKTHREREQLREKRKREQEANVAAKKEKEEAKRDKKRRKKEERKEKLNGEDEDEDSEEQEDGNDDSSDNDNSESEDEASDDEDNNDYESEEFDEEADIQDVSEADDDDDEGSSS